MCSSWGLRRHPEEVAPDLQAGQEQVPSSSSDPPLQWGSVRGTEPTFGLKLSVSFPFNQIPVPFPSKFPI